MYSVMLVDDEKLTLEYLKMTIPQQDSDWQVAAACSDGIAALEWLAHHRIDLIITDIKMPEMTGLELSRKVKELYPNQKIIILSGYDDFKFAQQAIQYGVRNYLLKPISLEDLRKALSEMKGILEKEKRESQAYARLLNMSESGKRQLALRFVKGVIDRAEPETRSLYPLIHRMKISLLEGAARLLVFDLDMELLLDNGLPVQDISLYQYMIYQMVLEISENQKDPVWTVLDRFSHTVVLLSADTADGSLQKCKDLYHIVSEALQSQMKLSLSSAVSKPFTDIFEADKAYAQSIALLNAKVFLSPGSFYSAANYTPEIRQKSASLHQAVSSLWAAVSDRNAVNQELALSSILVLMPRYARPEVLRFGLHWIQGIFSKWDEEISEHKKLCEQAILKLAENYADDTRESALRRFLSIAQLLSASGNSGTGNIDENLLITEAKNYILANYAQPLSLTMVADELGITPNYLSSLFHRETGESYIKYLTRVRIDHAIQLMKENPQMKIYDIVEKVGYVSVKHFSYVFRQTKGMSPSEYQSRLTT